MTRQDDGDVCMSFERVGSIQVLILCIEYLTMNLTKAIFRLVVPISISCEFGEKLRSSRRY